MKKYYSFVLLSCLIFLTSCAFLDSANPGIVERTVNREHLEHLKVGQTKKQVLAIMGEPLVYESYNTPDVWFYYTYWDWADFTRTKTECTPLVFKDGVLVGWGRVYYTKIEQKDWLFDSNSALVSESK
jgi:hypothetical protein